MGAGGVEVIASYPGRCTCGAEFDEGADVRWDDDDRRVTGCEDCDYTGKRRQVADLSCVRGGGRGLAAALRRRREKDAKRRAKEAGR